MKSLKVLFKLFFAIAIIGFVLFLVAGSIFPSLPAKLQLYFAKDSIPIDDIISTKNNVITYEFVGDPYNYNYWATYEPYKEILNCSNNKYLLIENGKTEGAVSDPVTKFNVPETAKVYEVTAEELKKCLKVMNKDLTDFWIAEGREDIVSANGSFPHNLKLIEEQYVDAIKTLTKSSNMGMYVNSPKGFLNNEKLKFTLNETNDFKSFGLMVDTNNIEIEKLAVFTKGRVVGIVSADVTTKQKDNKAQKLEWVPGVGETKRVTFFVDVIPSTTSAMGYNKNNIEVLNY